MDDGDTKLTVTEHRPFFTSIFTTSLDQNEVANLAEPIREIKRVSPSINKSNVGGWHSNIFDYNSHEFMKPVLNDVLEFASLIFNFHGISDPPKVLYWFNINHRYNYNRDHIHAGSVFSACLYVKTPANSGDLVFSRTDNLENCFFLDYNPNERTQFKYPISAKTGNLVMFPSNVMHGVEQNLADSTDDERISIALNFIY